MMVASSSGPLDRPVPADNTFLAFSSSIATAALPLYAYHYGSTDLSDDGNIVAFASNGQVYR